MFVWLSYRPSPLKMKNIPLRSRKTMHFQVLVNGHILMVWYYVKLLSFKIVIIDTTKYQYKAKNAIAMDTFDACNVFITHRSSIWGEKTMLSLSLDTSNLSRHNIMSYNNISLTG